MRQFFCSCVGAVVLCLTLMPAQAGSSQAGQVVYDENCAICHGEGLRNPGSSFDLVLLKPNEHGRFVSSVQSGKGQMPPWKGILSDSEIDDVWAYIRANAD